MHGGVFPKCEHGSIVTKILFLVLLVNLDNALCSAWGLPFIDVVPTDIISLVKFVTTQPTDGFGPVVNLFNFAKLKANSEKYFL